MTKKTKAEKIAASLRTKRHTDQTLSRNVQENVIQHDATKNVTTTERASSVPFVHQKDDVRVYEPKDLRKTFVITVFIVALLVLVYVFQYKGYF